MTADHYGDDDPIVGTAAAQGHPGAVDLADAKLRIRDLEAALVVAHRDLAVAQQEDADMVRERDDALLALGNAALKIQRLEAMGASDIAACRLLEMSKALDRSDEQTAKLWDIVRAANGGDWNGKALDECVAELVEELDSLRHDEKEHDELVDELWSIALTHSVSLETLPQVIRRLASRASMSCTPAERALIEAAVRWSHSYAPNYGDGLAGLDSFAREVIAERGKA